MPLNDDALARRVRDYLQREIDQHLSSRSKFVRTHKLRVNVLQCVEGNVGGLVSVEVSGMLDAQRVKIRARAKRSDVRYAPGGILGTIAATAVQQVGVAAFGDSSATHVQSCVAEVLANLLIELDRRIGVPPTENERRWRLLRVFRWTLLPIAYLSLTVLHAGRNPSGHVPNAPVMDWVMGAALAAIPAGCIFAAI